jgi:hypothetical protein
MEKFGRCFIDSEQICEDINVLFDIGNGCS